MTCTVRTATAGACGDTAVYTEGEFAECAKHAAMPGSLARTPRASTRAIGYHEVGDIVTVHRYGKAYRATVVRVGARGAAYATFRYGNGAERTVRV